MLVSGIMIIKAAGMSGTGKLSVFSCGGKCARARVRYDTDLRAKISERIVSQRRRFKKE